MKYLLKHSFKKSLCKLSVMLFVSKIYKRLSCFFLLTKWGTNRQDFALCKFIKESLFSEKFRAVGNHSLKFLLLGYQRLKSHHVFYIITASKF